MGGEGHHGMKVWGHILDALERHGRCASVTVTAVIVSVPLPVWNVNASAIVAAPEGAIVTLPGSVPVASVVTFGVIGEPVGTTPVAE